MQQTPTTISSTCRIDRRASLIEEHVPMARMMARKMARRLPSSVTWDELESAALLGLTEAACRYETDRAEPFMAFAAKRVRGAILDQLRRDDFLTRRGRRLARSVSETAASLENELGRSASDDEIGKATGLSIDEVREGAAALRRAKSEAFDEVSHSLDECTTTREAVARAQTRVELRHALDTLGERDTMVLSMLYRDGLTLREVGEILGVSESRVCQIHKRAIGELRERMV
jgi:RNA polymerase sigma factor for flagellar operon FliA